MAFTNQIIHDFLEHEFKIGTYTAPTHLYIGLSSTLPTVSGTNITEPTNGSYARPICDAWTRTNQSVANTSDIIFGTATADWNVSPLAYFFVADHLTNTGANILQFGTISPGSITVTNGQIVKFLAGQLAVSIA